MPSPFDAIHGASTRTLRKGGEMGPHATMSRGGFPMSERASALRCKPERDTVLAYYLVITATGLNRFLPREPATGRY